MTESAELLCWFLHLSVSVNHISPFLQTIFLSVCKSYFSVSANYISQCRSVESTALVEMRRRCQIALLLPPGTLQVKHQLPQLPKYWGSKIPSFASTIAWTTQVQVLNYPSTRLLPTLRNMSSRWTLGHNYTITPTSKVLRRSKISSQCILLKPGNIFSEEEKNVTNSYNN